MKTKRTIYTSIIFIVMFFISTIIGFDPHYSSSSNAEVVADADIEDKVEEPPPEAVSDYASNDSISDEENEHIEPTIEIMSLATLEDESSDWLSSFSIEEPLVGLPVSGVGLEPMDVKDLIREIVMENRYDDIGISVAESYVNIRKEPDTQSESLGKLHRGAAGKIIDIIDGWYLIESGSVKGYANSSYIKANIPYKELLENYSTISASINVDGLNVREEANIDSKKLTVVYINEEYPVLEVIDDWLKIKVEDDNISGYVNLDYVDIIADFDKAISREEEQEIQRIKREREEEKERQRLLEEERIKKETEIKYRDESSHTDDELKLLACLVHTEAGNQSYEGRLAVANVVLNRMKSSKYPNTMKEVIYQPGQFSVVKSGSLAKQLEKYDSYSTNSQKLTIKAAQDALDGANNIGDRLYFHQYKLAVKKGYHTSKKNSVKIEDQLFW